MADPQATFKANMTALGVNLSTDEGNNATVAPGDHEDKQLLDSLMCAVCQQGLDCMVTPDGEKALIHQRVWRTYDHDPVPVEVPPGTQRAELCDFCGADEPSVFWRLKGDRLVHQTGNLQTDNGATWSACEGCGNLLQRNDLEALLDRCMANFVALTSESNPAALKAARLSALTDWLKFLGTVNEMVYVGPRPGPARMNLRMMPSLQAGLVKFWRNPNLKLGVCSESKPFPIPLPTFVCGDAGTPMVDDFTRLFPDGVPVPEAAWDAHVAHQTANIWEADLFWISSQFTSLAIMAGKDFDVPVLNREDLPSDSGLLIWQDSVGEIPRHDPDVGGSAAVRAVHWTVIPDGIWVAFYVQIEDADPNGDIPTMRQNLGWLLCPNSGGGIPFGDVDVTNAEFVTIRTFLATLFLLKQPGVAEVLSAPVDKKEARKYQRNYKRAQPPVKLINLRKQPARSGQGGLTGPRGPINYRVYRRGHWKQQPYGPKRGLRRKTYVMGYIAGPDGAPLRAVKPDVKVLK